MHFCNTLIQKNRTMKKLKNLFLVVVLLCSSAIFAQTKLSGKVVDDTNQPLPGASVVVKGTKTGASTDFDGKFNLETTTSNGTLVISFVGYGSKTVNFTKGGDIGVVLLKASAESLNEVVIMGVIDVAKERQTPVAVSTIKAEEIIEKLGSQEFPEILNSTPSVYATKSGGGFGDSRINIRGFDQRNTAILINGIPVNDMENGWVYWSNWAGLSDVTSAMQVQRGLGSSKLAISSVGGTVNVLTRTSAQKEGGSITTSFGNDNYLKYVASYSTGLLDSGLSSSILFSKTTGDGYVDGTEFEGYNYFIGLGYKFNEKNEIMFTFTGAPQWHNQSSRASSIADYIKYGGNPEEPNRKYNESWGYLDGKVYSFRRNFYHKPLMSLNWDWSINNNSKLSTVLYGSWGRGGGTGPIGEINGKPDYYSQFRDQTTGLIRFDDIKAWNSGQSVPDFGADRTSPFINDRNNGFTNRASMNSHNWYGVITNFHNDANKNLSWDLGLDGRLYKGIHYRVVNDILGASGYTDNRDKNNPNRAITNFVEASPSWNPFQNITNQQKIEYYNDGGVRWLGAFGQVEYKTDAISTFIQAAFSNQAFQRVDYFNLGAYNGTEQKSSWKSILGGDIKGGINWNINEKHNVFANGGYYSKQPLWQAVYPSFVNNSTNAGLTNEKIIGLEIGYGFKSENYKVNINAYRTSWKDRFKRQSITATNGYIDFQGIEQVHIGAELEASAKFGKFQFDLMGSVGDWQYKGDVVGIEYDQNNLPVGNSNKTFYFDGVKVGDAAQITARIGITYEIVEGLKIDISEQYFDKLYAAIDENSFTTPVNSGSLKLPSYALIDAGLSYKLNLGSKKSINFRINVNNLADTYYIAESATNYQAGLNDPTWKGISTSNRVYWGFGRTWNLSARFNF